MSRHTDHPSPMVSNAKTVFLPKCEATSDEIIRAIVEGYTARQRDVTKTGNGRKEAA